MNQITRSVAAAVIGASGMAHGQTCGTEVVFDMSPWYPSGVSGEAISIAMLQGEVVHARVDAVFVSNELAEWSMFANFDFPTGITGVDSMTGKWQGLGTFKMTVETDALNGLLVAPPGSEFIVWYLMWGGGTPVKLPGGGISLVPMDGYFEELKLTLTLADCPPGDVNSDIAVDVDDLLIVINNWGSCAVNECEGDLTGDEVVDVDDLLQVINNWGNYWCPPPLC